MIQKVFDVWAVLMMAWLMLAVSAAAIYVTWDAIKEFRRSR